MASYGVAFVVWRFAYGTSGYGTLWYDTLRYGAFIVEWPLGDTLRDRSVDQENRITGHTMNSPRERPLGDPWVPPLGAISACVLPGGRMQRALG